MPFARPSPAGCGSGASFQLLAWRVGRRAVFRVWHDDGPRICKIYRKNRNLLERWTVLEPVLNPCAGVHRAYWAGDAELRCLTIENCSGASLNSRWLAGNGVAADGDRIADLLEWIQDAPVPEAFPRYGNDDEIKLLAGRLESFERTLRSPSPKVRELTDRVIDALGRHRTEVSMLCHRDLHDKQILLDGRRGSLIDLDLAAAGPPGLDVGQHPRPSTAARPEGGGPAVAGKLPGGSARERLAPAGSSTH